LSVCNHGWCAGEEVEYGQWLALQPAGGAVCVPCGTAFTHTTNARRHVRTAHMARQQACDNCGKWFKNERSLKSHWKSCTYPRVWCV